MVIKKRPKLTDEYVWSRLPACNRWKKYGERFISRQLLVAAIDATKPNAKNVPINQGETVPDKFESISSNSSSLRRQANVDENQRGL